MRILPVTNHFSFYQKNAFTSSFYLIYNELRVKVDVFLPSLCFFVAFTGEGLFVACLHPSPVYSQFIISEGEGSEGFF